MSFDLATGTPVTFMLTPGDGYAAVVTGRSGHSRQWPYVPMWRVRLTDGDRGMYRVTPSAIKLHADYPHTPGTLYDCPACEAACHCRDGSCVACALATGYWER